MLIMKKVRLVNPVVPVIPTGLGTFLVVDATASRTFGITTGTLAAGSESVTVDWGDGERQTVEGRVDKLVHSYSKPGLFVVSISDDLNGFAVGSITTDEFGLVYPKMLLLIVSRGKVKDALRYCCRNAANLVSVDFKECGLATLYTSVFEGCSKLTTLDGLPPTVSTLGRQCFSQCTSLVGSVRLPGVSAIAGSTADTLPFAGCDGLNEIHFSAANEGAIKATSAWSVDPKLGAANAAVYFDL